MPGRRHSPLAGEQAGVSDLAPAAISVAAQQHGAVIVDQRGEVVRPAKLWNDTESAPDAQALVDELTGGAAAWAEACGSVPLASFTITKLRWLKRCEPDSFRRMASVLLPHDWLTFRLTGHRTTDRGDASGTGYWSPAEGRYRSDLLRSGGRPGRLGRHAPLGARTPGRGRTVGGHRFNGGAGDRRQYGQRPGPGPAPRGPLPQFRDERGGLHGHRGAPGRSFGDGGRVRRRHRPFPPSHLHPQRHQGDRLGGPALGGRPRGVRCPGAVRSPRGPGHGAGPPLRRRADAQPT